MGGLWEDRTSYRQIRLLTGRLAFLEFDTETRPSRLYADLKANVACTFAFLTSNKQTRSSPLLIRKTLSYPAHVHHFFRRTISWPQTARFPRSSLACRLFRLPLAWILGEKVFFLLWIHLCLLTYLNPLSFASADVLYFHAF